MKQFALDASVAPYFSLASVALSHGWVNLAPFAWDSERGELSFLVEGEGGPLEVRLRQESPDRLAVASSLDLGRKGRDALSARIRWMLGWDQDLGPLEALCRQAGKTEYLELIRAGHGRILRSATCWEDAVKTICTTNASWAFTQLMCRNLCEFLGSGGCFPSPEVLAGCDEAFLKEKVKTGYRGPYLAELARSIVSGKLELELLAPGASAAAHAEKTIRAVKGLGPYGASHMLVLLGWHQYLPVDREVMKHLGIRQESPNAKCPWKTAHYEEWGDYRFTVYKLDRVLKKQNWIGD